MRVWVEMEQDAVFLQEQITLAERKTERINNALTACHECQEGESLQKMLQAAQCEQQLLSDLSAHLSDTSASLETLILERLDQYQQAAARLSSRWHRGQPTPPAYWEAESKREFLARLLRRYHAWQAGRPYYEPVQTLAAAPPPATTHPATNRFSKQASAVYLHPWYLPPAQPSPEDNVPNDLEQLMALGQEIQEALRCQGFDQAMLDTHLRIIVQEQGYVIVEGYAHDQEAHDRISKTVSAQPRVEETLMDIQVVSEGHCPICVGKHSG